MNDPSNWQLQVELYRNDLDIGTLARDPRKHATHIATLEARNTIIRRRLGQLAGRIYPVALELTRADRPPVRVIVESPLDAAQYFMRWIRTHPGAGSIEQAARVNAWAEPVLRSLRDATP